MKSVSLVVLALVASSSFADSEERRQPRALQLAQWTEPNAAAAREVVRRSVRETEDESRVSLTLEVLAGMSDSRVSVVGGTGFSNEGSSPTLGFNLDFRYADFGIELRSLAHHSESMSMQPGSLESGGESHTLSTNQSVLAAEVSLKYQPILNLGSFEIAPKVGLGYNVQGYNSDHSYGRLEPFNGDLKQMVESAGNSTSLTSNGFHGLVGLDLSPSPAMLISADVRFEISQSASHSHQSFDVPPTAEPSFPTDAQAGRARLGVKFRLQEGFYLGGEYQSLFFNQDELLGPGATSYLGTVSYRF